MIVLPDIYFFWADEMRGMKWRLLNTPSCSQQKCIQNCTITIHTENSSTYIHARIKCRCCVSEQKRNWYASLFFVAGCWYVKCTLFATTITVTITRIRDIVSWALWWDTMDSNLMTFMNHYGCVELIFAMHESTSPLTWPLPMDQV